MTGSAQPPEYLAEHIRDALAGDPRVGELDMHVTVTADHVLVTGNVASPERQRAVSDVLESLDLGRAVHNATTVMEFAEPHVVEDLP